MKNINLIILILVLLTGCQSTNSIGDCKGFLTSEDPNVEYEISPNNAVWSMIGAPLVLPVILWPLSYAKCPVYRKQND